MTQMAFPWSSKFMKFGKTTSFIPGNTIPVANLIQLRDNHTKHRKCLHFFSRFVLSNLWWLTPTSPMWRQISVFRVTSPGISPTSGTAGCKGRWVPYPKPHYSSFPFSLKPSHSGTFPPPSLPPALASGLPTGAQETLEAHLSLPLWGPLSHRQSWLLAAPTPKPFVNVAEQLTTVGVFVLLPLPKSAVSQRQGLSVSGA